MKSYKSFLLFSTGILLFTGSVVSADEVTETTSPSGEVVTQVAETTAPTVDATNQATKMMVSDEGVTASKSEETSAVAPTQNNPSGSSKATDQTEPSTSPQSNQEGATAPSSEAQAPETIESESLSEEEYKANMANFKHVTMADVYHMFDDEEGNYTLYIGRPTCHYCRDFSPVLKEFNDLSGRQVYYLNTDNADFTPASKEFLRRKIGTYATPTLLHIERGQIVSGQLGSGGTAQELYDKVFSPVNSNKVAIPQPQKTPVAAKAESASEPIQTTTEKTAVRKKEKQVKNKVTSQKKTDNDIQIANVIAKMKDWMKNFLGR